MDPFGHKRIKELENLVGLLKKDKSTQRRNFFGSLRASLDQGAAEKIEFMTRNEELTMHPYMFVNTKGIILGYTKALEVILGITQDVKGEHYLDIFHFPNESQETRKSLEKYFSSPEEIKVPYDRQDKKRTRKLIITKEKPVYTGEIEIKLLSSTKYIRTVSYVPIHVSSRKRKMRIPGLSREDAEEKAAHLNQVTLNLIVNHNWSSERIDNYTAEHGQQGLIKKYEQLENKVK